MNKLARLWGRWSGWVGNIFLITGAICLGDRWRYAFLFVFLGETIWSFRVYKSRQWDMLFICILFGLIALRNFWMWTP